MLLKRARHDTREWIVKRRERTRHLIELGGLMTKSGLVELAGDDRATIYGALLELMAKARGEDGEKVLALWRRRGKRAFETEAQEQAPPGDCRTGRSTPVSRSTGHVTGETK